ncbi:MAG: glycosyltransferase family 1 protein [Anaerolineae bacterium]|nr:glycosyltransferase family 1 protein [Anaerolineae bacterium]
MMRDGQPARDVAATGTTLYKTDLLVFSHLRWDFVFQRPQHLLSRAAADRRVFFWEEALPLPDGKTEPYLDVQQKQPNLWVVRPFLPFALEGQPREELKAGMLAAFMAQQGITRFVAWYYTPWALRFTSKLKPAVTVYDCMDELSLFRGANPQLKQFELELFRRADVVFTGGASLYEAKRTQHQNVHLFPSSIDTAHFGKARLRQEESAGSVASDQAAIPHPRLGFFGVIDERMDLDLLREIAARRPDWHLALIGPVVKIDQQSLPQAPNIHYLGQKAYEQLPLYLAGWDVALMPFAHNEATRFISPTKTPEYLAGGIPVVSTSIRDVVRPYGEQGLVRIADSAEDTVAAIEAALALSPAQRADWQARVDEFLKGNSWDRTWAEMDRLIADRIESRATDVSKVESR